MNGVMRRRLKTALFLSCAGVACAAWTSAAPAVAQAADTQQAAFDIPAQDLGSALTLLSQRSGREIIFASDVVRGVRSKDVRAADFESALEALLQGTGLASRINASGVVVVTRSDIQGAAEPQQPKPVADSEGTDEEVVVTARRREERIIDVPLSVSAFSGERLAALKIEGGSELLRGVPNVNFSKDNFTGYNFAIRGIGTKAISVTTDPAVAISFNGTALLRNRLFEQEYFDVQRLEVLRGPQGTLYGRNATAGVVNMLPNLPELGVFAGDLELETGNYDSRRARGFINIPLADTLSVRFAGALTTRDGYDYNAVTAQNVNGRDLWSIRSSVLWEPASWLRVHAAWEHFEEDDNRSRTGKQLCTRGEAPTELGWTDPDGNVRVSPVFTRWTSDSLTPGCTPGSLYADEAFGAPNGRGFPIVTGLILTTPFGDSGSVPNEWGGYLFRLGLDPFSPASGTQSRDLREVETFFDPVFRAKNDVFQFNVEADIADGVTLYSQTLYMEDSYYGSQDYFRINPQAGLIACRDGRVLNAGWDAYLGPCTGSGDDAFGGGTFIDPQLGTHDRLVAVDLSQSESRQWSQEFRLQSSFDGPFNFNLGANYLSFETEENYYVFSNAFTIAALGQNSACPPFSATPSADPNECTYVDPNPIDQVDGEGHNYYRNLNIAKTKSWAVFGEGYLFLSENMRLTAGLRYTHDEKTMTPVPTQLLASTNPFSGGVVGKGYPRYPEEVRSWGEFTGRVAVDWRPDVAFTDETLVYASYSRGYKGGGGNPRGPQGDENATNYTPLPTGFEPEFVDAYEIGVKNSLLGNKLTLGVAGFYYDYKDYQVTQVIDRSMHNENFDARIWGLEFEAAWSPSRNFRIDATVGYLNTRIADGESSIDVMDRLQGNDDWTVLRPWPTSPATCVVPKEVLGRYIEAYDVPLSAFNDTGAVFVKLMCPGPQLFGGVFLDPAMAWFADQWGPITYNPITDGPNQGRGFSADLSGNHLPNAPEFTFNIGVQYRIELEDWDILVRGDYYRQSESFARVYNTEYDRLRAWDNANLTVTFARADSNFAVQVYVKNVFDKTPITDAFTGPDETGNNTNVFTLDPRLVGVSVKAGF